MNRLTSGVRMKHVLDRLERPEPDDVADAAGAVVADVEAPRLVGEVRVADQLDVARIADAQAGLVRQADVLDAAAGRSPSVLAATASMATWSPLSRA